MSDQMIICRQEDQGDVTLSVLRRSLHPEPRVGSVRMSSSVSVAWIALPWALRIKKLIGGRSLSLVSSAALYIMHNAELSMSYPAYDSIPALEEENAEWSSLTSGESASLPSQPVGASQSTLLAVL
jgi:hypothetical protein